MKKWFPYPQLLDHVSPKVIQGRIQRLKRGVKIEKVRICFATLESVELHICFFCNIVIKLIYCEISEL